MEVPFTFESSGNHLYFSGDGGQYDMPDRTPVLTRHSASMIILVLSGLWRLVEFLFRYVTKRAARTIHRQ